MAKRFWDKLFLDFRMILWLFCTRNRRFRMLVRSLPCPDTFHIASASCSLSGCRCRTIGGRLVRCLSFFSQTRPSTTTSITIPLALSFCSDCKSPMRSICRRTNIILTLWQLYPAKMRCSQLIKSVEDVSSVWFIRSLMPALFFKESYSWLRSSVKTVQTMDDAIPNTEGLVWVF